MVCTVGWQTWESRNNYKEKLIAAWIHPCIHLGFGRQHGVSHACGRSYKPWMKCENTGNTKTLPNVWKRWKFAPVGPLPGLTGRSGLKVWQLPAPEQVTELSKKRQLGTARRRWHLRILARWLPTHPVSSSGWQRKFQLRQPRKTISCVHSSEELWGFKTSRPGK